MFRRDLIIICAALYLFIFAAFAQAQLPQITSGLNYLISSQNPDGTWSTSTAQVETTAATVSTLETLKLLNQTSGSSYVAGTSWLQSQSPLSVDYIADRIRTLNLTDNSINALLLLVDSIKGGWGGDEGYLTNNLETSLAIQALKSANYHDLSTINPALAYLTTSQNPDGGWGFNRGGDSNAYLTAVVSATLQQFPQMTTIATAVNKATTYLLAHQNADGGFGNSPSTVYETALAYSALVGNGQTQGLPLQNAVNYLTEAQSANGSWNDDPYSTALALKALYLSENKPSPPPPPPAGGMITGTVIDAVTKARVSGVAIVLGSNSLINTTTDSSGNFTLPDVPAGTQMVTFSLSGYASNTASTNVALDSVASLGNIPLVSSYSTGTVAGTITDAAGKPLTDVAITVTGAWSGSAVTGADGSYSLTYVTPGEVTIAAAKVGYQPVTCTGTVFARTELSFSPRLSTAVPQGSTGTLVGRVVDDYWGLPIGHLPEDRGVTIILSGGISVEPDERGYFTVQGLAPNTYQVTVGMNGFAWKTFRLLIPGGVTTDLGTIRLSLSLSTMTLSGKVTDASTGAPIPEAEVAVVGSNLTARTDFAGTYVVAEIPYPGDFTLKASATGFTGKSYLMGAAPGMQIADISLSPLVTTGSLTGVVVDAATSEPLTGVALTLASDPAVNATTGSAGSFNFPSILEGSQQIVLSLAGYAPRTLTTAIIAGGTNNVGSIALSVTPLSASIQGTVWDAVAKSPFSGVDILATGEGERQSVTAADGSYRIDDVTPGTVTVAATVATKPGYYGARFTGTLAPGGILVFNPALSTAPPAAVGLTLKTDKEDYLKGDTIGISVNLLNRVSVAHSASLHVQVTDPSGTSLYDGSLEVTLPADGAMSRDVSFVLPDTAQGGAYTIVADLYDPSGAVLGAASKSFGVTVSRISVTPTLPPIFSTGANTVSFNLANTGTLSVSAGTLAVNLKDPDGQVISSASEPFGLGLGESRTLTYNVSIPALKFGTYTLSYLQSDETKAGQAIGIALPNTVAIAPLFDSNSHRIRETGNLMVTLNNTGRFNLDSASGSGMSVTVSVPDAAYSETKTPSPAPAVGNAAGSTLLFPFVIPETLTAGQHGTKITLTLPSGDEIVQVAQLAILDASLSIAPIQAAYTAGEMILPVMTNSGGVDAPVQYRLTLYDAKSALIAEKSNTEAAVAGSSLPLSLAIPAGAVDGAYTLVVNYKDLKTGTEAILPHPITVNGVKGALQVQTSKQSYLLTESITGLSSITNSTLPLQGGNLHLQVTTAGGSQQKKSWTSRYDFQQGVRKDVDTFETPDDVTLVSLSDNFNDGILNPDRWSVTGVPGFLPAEANGTVRMLAPANPTNLDKGAFISAKSRITGDFDVSFDFDVLSQRQAQENDSIDLTIGTPYYWMRVLLQRAPWLSGPSVGTVGSNGTSKWVQNTTAKGKLRLSRVGSTYSTYYWNGTDWTRLISEVGRADGLTNLSIGVWNQYSPGTLEVLLDNFTLTTHTYPASGTFNLKYDSGRSDVWGNLNYSADTPAGSSIKFRTRTAESAAGLSTATWSGYLTGNGLAITSPQGRWIEIETTLATTDTRITPVLHELSVTQGHDPGYVLWQTDVPVNLAQSAVGELNNSIGALNTSGQLYLQGMLTSSTGQTLATSEYPFYVGQGNTGLTVNPDKKIYKPGETVTIIGEVKNLSAIEAANLSLAVKAKPVGGAEQTLSTVTFTIAAGESRPFTATTIAGSDGLVDLTGTATQNGTTLVQVAARYEVATPKVTAALTAPDTAGNDPFTVSLAMTNSGKTDAVIMVGRSFSSLTETVTVPAGEMKLLQYAQQIVAGTTYSFTLSGDLNQALTKRVAYAVTPLDSGIGAKIVTDKISYDPNQQVTLTATVTANTARENLSARITISNSQGQAVYSGTSAIAALIPGQTVSINKYWNTGTNPAGTYLVTFQNLDAAGSVISKATCDLVISSTTKPTALLKGQLLLDRQSILSGEPVSASYSVINTGNLDLPAIQLSLLTVALDEETVYGSNSDRASLAMGASYNNSSSIDTMSYRAKDYLVLLRGSIAGGEAETLGSAYFRVQGAPSAPALSGPAQGADLETFTPALSVGNAADPNDDRLSYQFEIYSDSGLTTLVDSGIVTETAGITAWTVSAPLTENRTYFWRARAHDGLLYGPWMAPASFRVNTVNDLSAPPTISSPVDGTDVAVLTPLLSVGNATDPDSENLTYNFQIALDPDFTQIVASVVGISSGEATTSWAVPENLQENGVYYWRAQADDWLIEGPWSATARFFVNTANEAPAAPVVIAPASGATITALGTDVTIANSTDPDSPVLSYYFEADTVPTFDSARTIRSGSVTEGHDTTIWHLSGLQDNTRYYLRAKAGDGTAESPWSAVTGFFANTTNDPPTTPIPANPSSGAGVTSYSPTLSVHNAADLDKDALTYQFELYSDQARTNLVSQAAGIVEAAPVTGWKVPVSLTENQNYFWRARAFDGALYSDWTAAASFMVNTANDAPDAPKLSSPAEGGSVVTLMPMLAVVNAVDPDSDNLTYEFEIYSAGSLVTAINGVTGDSSGITRWTPGTPLADNSVYQWRARAYDGDSYGPWTAMASFTVHVPQTSINATVDFDPDTLNRASKGTWVVVYIELPAGYQASDVDLSSVRLEGSIPAEARPYAIGDHDKDGIADLMVKFKRSELINLLRDGDRVPVQVTGKVGSMLFEGVDVIRVIE